LRYAPSGAGITFGAQVALVKTSVACLCASGRQARSFTGASFSGPQRFRQGEETQIGVGSVAPAIRGKATSANNTVHFDSAVTAQVAAA
jgi:hypothetical protein